MQASVAERILAKSRYAKTAGEFGRLVGGVIDAEDRELFWFARNRERDLRRILHWHETAPAT